MCCVCIWMFVTFCIKALMRRNVNLITQNSVRFLFIRGRERLGPEIYVALYERGLH